MKRLSVLLLALLLLLAASGCSVKKKEPAASAPAASAATQAGTRVPNAFKEALPAFKFDGEATESYDEGLRYAFSAPCSEKTFEKYTKALEKAGFKEKAVTGKGYYAAYQAAGMYAEAVLKNESITVTVKRAG